MKEQEEDKKRREKKRSDMLALDTNAYATELKALQAEYDAYRESVQQEYSQLLASPYAQHPEDVYKNDARKREIEAQLITLRMRLRVEKTICGKHRTSRSTMA
jgi:hypothetical protein